MALRYLGNVVTLALDGGRCNGCGMCSIVCPHAVFTVEGGRARIADRDACMECGACARNCSRSAISVRAGVGCAAGILAGMKRGNEPTRDCSSDYASGCQS